MDSLTQLPKLKTKHRHGSRSVVRLMRKIHGGYLIAVISDEDSVVGFLLGGIGEYFPSQPADFRYNFFAVQRDTDDAEILKYFNYFTRRRDVAILLIGQPYAERIRQTIEEYRQLYPSILEIPTKTVPYNPELDTILKRAALSIESK